MVGGGLIILPKKSWNVWNKDNIAKIKRDEENAAKKKEEIEREMEREMGKSEVDGDVVYGNFGGKHEGGGLSLDDFAPPTIAEHAVEQPYGRVVNYGPLI